MFEALKKIVLGTACLLLLAIAGASIYSKKGDPPGLEHGFLRPCPDKPNCVCSQHKGGDNFIEPLLYNGVGEREFERLAALLETLPDFTITVREDDYIHAEAKTEWLRFVDDVEFLLSHTESVIHVRSASRVGHSDMGANRKRIEALRERF